MGSYGGGSGSMKGDDPNVPDIDNSSSESSPDFSNSIIPKVKAVFFWIFMGLIGLILYLKITGKI